MIVVELMLENGRGTERRKYIYSGSELEIWSGDLGLKGQRLFSVFKFSAFSLHIALKLVASLFACSLVPPERQGWIHPRTRG